MAVDPSQRRAPDGPYRPAAGTRRGPAPRQTRVSPPAFLRLEGQSAVAENGVNELDLLINVLRNPLADAVYLRMLAMSRLFDTGEYLGSYAQLMDLCTPPRPERGPARKGPTYDALRQALDDLESVGLISRDRAANFNHGQLRVYLIPRKKRISNPMKKTLVQAKTPQKTPQTLGSKKPSK